MKQENQETEEVKSVEEVKEDKKKETVRTKRKLQLVVSNDPNKEKSRSSGIDY